MLIPTSLGATLLALVLTGLLWSTWANLQRAGGKWRFEFFAFDFGFGAALGAAVLAFTVGNVDSSIGFTFDDAITVASKRNMATAFSGGAIYCLGNIMTLAGVVLGGMSLALPATAATALLLAVALAAAFGGAPVSPGTVYGGAAAALAVLVAVTMAQKAAKAAAPVKKGMHPATKGFILSCVGGVLSGCALPIVESSRGGDIGLAAYGAAAFMALGILAVTPLVNLYFLNLPVQGDTASLLGYFKGTLRQHLLGLAGGALWATGTTLFFSAASGAYLGAPRFLAHEAVVYGGAVLGGLSGLLFWGEHAGAGKAKALLCAAMALLAAAGTLVFYGA